MKVFSESRGLGRLSKLKDDFRELVQKSYEHKAKPCSECSTPGACCLDAHFVNVRISRLEAVRIRQMLCRLPEGKRSQLFRRIDAVITTFKLDVTDPAKTYICPLFDPEVGCLIHESGKPLPCIHHACYEREEDLPPDEILNDAEIRVERLNRMVYGRSLPLLPLPIAVKQVM